MELSKRSLFLFCCNQVAVAPGKGGVVELKRKASRYAEQYPLDRPEQ